VSGDGGDLPVAEGQAQFTVAQRAQFPSEWLASGGFVGVIGSVD
jgi:hypothetical protein